MRGEKSMLTDDKLAELEAIGFEFQVGPIQPYRDPSMIKTWDERFKEMLEFKESNGHCMIPQTYVNGPLGHWVHTQRKEYQNMKKGLSSSLSLEKVLKLTEAGFAFSVRRKSVPS
mmetsp:Transcript_22553/g.26002  ORF Transcript_22553/g.26002 Transcript_22553/m.26002 type:complete len:115 (-) Transcript_22553:13-357(-)